MPATSPVDSDQQSNEFKIALNQIWAANAIT